MYTPFFRTYGGRKLFFYAVVLTWRNLHVAKGQSTKAVYVDKN